MGSVKSLSSEHGHRHSVNNRFPRASKKELREEAQREVKWRIHWVDKSTLEIYGSKLKVLRIIRDSRVFTPWARLEKLVDGTVQWVEINRIDTSLENAA